MSGFSCVTCGAEKGPCCDVSGGAKQACQDGQQCGSDHMCPAAVGPGWAGDPCGTGQQQCNGKLSCNTQKNQCECNQSAEWTVCSADNTKVCAPGSGPPPGPPSGACQGWPSSAGFKPKGPNDSLCKMFKGNCDPSDKVCAKGQFHTIQVKGQPSKACANSDAAGEAVLKSSFAGSTDPSQTNFCFVAA